MHGLAYFFYVYLSETRSRKSVGHRFWAFLRLGRHPDSEGTTKGTNPSLRRNLVKYMERGSILKNHMLVLVTIKEKVLDNISNQWNAASVTLHPLLLWIWRRVCKKHNAAIRRKIVSTHFIWNLCGRYMISDNVLREHIEYHNSTFRREANMKQCNMCGYTS